MQLYRVKLNEGHTAKPDQMAGEYLGNYSTIDPALYTLSEARKKARAFGGSTEPFGRDYHLNELKVIQIPNEQLSERLLNELKGRESFTDTDDMLEESIFSSDVFETILGEVDEEIKLQKLITWGSYQPFIDELLVLNELTKDSQYVMITTI
jgi:hypothetical protein